MTEEVEDTYLVPLMLDKKPEEIRRFYPYSLNDKPVFMGVDLGFGGDQTRGQSCVVCGLSKVNKE